VKRHSWPPALPPDTDPEELPHDTALERTLAELAEEVRLAAEADRHGPPDEYEPEEDRKRYRIPGEEE
jgi:hypothetical protein